jgi:hypothetical protein
MNLRVDSLSEAADELKDVATWNFATFLDHNFFLQQKIPTFAGRDWKSPISEKNNAIL